MSGLDVDECVRRAVRGGECVNVNGRGMFELADSSLGKHPVEPGFDCSDELVVIVNVSGMPWLHFVPDEQVTLVSQRRREDRARLVPAWCVHLDWMMRVSEAQAIAGPGGADAWAHQIPCAELVRWCASQGDAAYAARYLLSLARLGASLASALELLRRPCPSPPEDSPTAKPTRAR